MLRGYRLAVIAAFGWLSLAAGPAPDNANSSKQAKPAQTIERSLETVAAAQDKIAKASETGEYQSPCGDGQYNNKSDLCAQWYAARAAKDAADWAYYALIVGLVGAFGIVIALGLTIQSNRIARDTATRQLRAYLSFELENLGVNFIPDVPIKINFKVLNSGATPALNCNIQHSAALGFQETNWSYYPIKRNMKESRSVVKDIPMDAYIQSNFILSEYQIGLINRGMNVFSGRIAVFYDDFFGVERCTQVAIVIQSIVDGKAVVLLAGTGQIAT
jgi:hypothetical protein